MKNVWTSKIDVILSVGRSLESIGVCNWAVERDAALRALERLFFAGVAILGGDVYRISSSDIESSYDNWYCNRNSEETEFEFVSRSIAEAKAYITHYQSTENTLFAIVPSAATASV